RHILSLKSAMIEGLQEKVPGVSFNGASAELEQSLYTILNVSLPPSEDNDMLLFNLDLKQISASGGSACSSGSSMGSHVLKALQADPARGHIRFSFSKYNTTEEVQYVVNKLAEMYSTIKV
ncbi:MAG: aminotransferase class V-fold PLP-dependent enzyme, partial [bacterium]